MKQQTKEAVTAMMLAAAKSLGGDPSTAIVTICGSSPIETGEYDWCTKDDDHIQITDEDLSI